MAVNALWFTSVMLLNCCLRSCLQFFNILSVFAGVSPGCRTSLLLCIVVISQKRIVYICDLMHCIGRRNANFKVCAVFVCLLVLSKASLEPVIRY